MAGTGTVPVLVATVLFGSRSIDSMKNILLRQSTNFGTKTGPSISKPQLLVLTEAFACPSRLFDQVFAAKSLV
jgi:hypothetical protein